MDVGMDMVKRIVVVVDIWTLDTMLIVDMLGKLTKPH